MTRRAIRLMVRAIGPYRRRKMTGHDLDSVMKALGFDNQQDFADYLDVDVRTVRRWLKDEITIPRTIVLLLAFMQQTSPNRWPRYETSTWPGPATSPSTGTATYGATWSHCGGSKPASAPNNRHCLNCGKIIGRQANAMRPNATRRPVCSPSSTSSGAVNLKIP